MPAKREVLARPCGLLLAILPLLLAQERGVINGLNLVCFQPVESAKNGRSLDGRFGNNIGL